MKIGIRGAGHWAWGISVDVGDSKKHLPIYTNQKSNTATPVQCRALKVFPTYTFHLPIYTLLWTPNPQEAHCFTSTYKQLCPTQSAMLHSIGNSKQLCVHQSAYGDQEWGPIYFVLETLGYKLGLIPINYTFATILHSIGNRIQFCVHQSAYSDVQYILS